MTEFHEGQDVEVWVNGYSWCKTKIVLVQRPVTWTGDTLYEVQFPDGTRAVFRAEHIREIEPRRNEATASENSWHLRSKF